MYKSTRRLAGLLRLSRIRYIAPNIRTIMAFKTSLVARSLLDRIPVSERPYAIREAVLALTAQSSPADVALTVNLLAAQPDDFAKGDLLSRLLEAVEQNELAVVEAACASDPTLRDELLDLVVERLGSEATRLSQKPGKANRVPLNDVVRLEGDVTGSLHTKEAAPETIKSMLRFARLSCSSLRGAGSHRLLSAVLIFLGASDHGICRSARDLLFTNFTALTDPALGDNLPIWACTQRLFTADADTFYHDLGYSIWLRQCSGTASSIKSWFDPTYWALIRHGLRNGDPERRKQCLAILRRSIAVAVRDESAWRTVCCQHSNEQGVGKWTSPLLQHRMHRMLAYACQACSADFHDFKEN